jgi:hypothetical protein
VIKSLDIKLKILFYMSVFRQKHCKRAGGKAEIPAYPTGMGSFE